jgi:hypothetical protein
VSYWVGPHLTHISDVILVNLLFEAEDTEQACVAVLVSNTQGQILPLPLTEIITVICVRFITRS